MKMKTFDCVKWVREIRDANYEKYKHLSTKEFAEKLSESARKSDLWKELKCQKSK